MSARINIVLVIGATAGLGEALARRFHSLGKTVIATGRRQDKLDELARELPGLQTRVWDMSNISMIKPAVDGILKDFPTLDSVLVSAGIQNHYQLFAPPDESMISHEISTNLTAPTLIAQYFAPHLLKLAQSGTKTNLFLTSSSLAYIPLAFYPMYCATKAGIAAFTRVLRMQLAFTGCKDISVVEIVPPYVDTGLNSAHRDTTDALQGGKDKAFPPMPLAEYTEKWFAGLEDVEADGSLKKEIGVGFGADGAKIWRGAFPPVYEAMGIPI